MFGDPLNYLSLEGFRYYVHFVDYFMKYTWIYPLKLKSKVKDIFLMFKTYVERQFKCQFQSLQTN